MNAVTTGRLCECGCGREIVATLRTRRTKRFYSDACRFQAWKAGKQQELQTLVKQLAGRGLGV